MKHNQEQEWESLIPCELVDGKFCDGYQKPIYSTDGTANPRIIGYEKYPAGTCKCGASQRRERAKALLLQAHQAGRAEMAEEIRVIVEKQRSNNPAYHAYADVNRAVDNILAPLTNQEEEK